MSKAVNGEGAGAKHAVDRTAPPAPTLAPARLKKAGGSLVVTVPAAARHMLQLTEGQQMAVRVEGSKLTLEPIPDGASQKPRRPRYTLDELLAQCEPETGRDEDGQAWIEAPAAGREAW